MENLNVDELIMNISKKTEEGHTFEEEGARDEILMENQEEMSHLPDDEANEEIDESGVNKTTDLSIDELHNEILELKALFEKKMLIDVQKNGIIDSLSSELKSHQDGLYEKIFKPILLDMIEIVNDLHRMVCAYRKKEDTTIDIKKFISILSIYESDLEDILEKYDVKGFKVEGDEFDAKKQKIVKVVETEERNLHRKVAERVHKGFELDGRVIVPERVIVYKYTVKEINSEISDDKTDKNTKANELED